MLSLEKIEIEDADAQNENSEAWSDQIARLETELAALKDKHNRFSGMIMAAMADEIKVLISGEVSEQLSKAAPEWNIDQHRTEIMDVVNDDFDIDDHQYGVENIIDNHFTFDNYSDSINDMIRDYLNDCTVTIETP